MVQVTVTDPTNHGEGRSMYTTYKVEVINAVSRFDRRYDYGDSEVGPKGGYPNSKVHRRYSDFQWLYQRFLTERAGAIVPIIPHRRAIGTEARISDDLVQERRENLEKFLQEVIKLPELCDAPSLLVFLSESDDDDAFDLAKKKLEKTKPNITLSHHESSNYDDDDENEYWESEATSLTSSGGASTSGGGAGVGKIRNLFAKASVAVSVLTNSTELEKTPDDDEIDKITQYASELDQQVKTILRESTSLVKASNDQATSYKEIGLAIFEWSKTLGSARTVSSPSNDDTKLISSKLGKISSVTSDVSMIYMKKSQTEHLRLEESLDELQRMIQAIKVALQKRRDKQLTYTTRIKQIDNRKTNLNKYQRKNLIQKIPQAKLDLATSEREAHASRIELDDISKRLLREIDRIQDTLHLHLISTMKQFANVQSDYNSKLYDSWSNLIPVLDDTTTSTSTSPRNGSAKIPAATVDTTSSFSPTDPAQPSAPPEDEDDNMEEQDLIDMI